MNSVKNKKGLSITVVFKAQSLNYGEGIGNISELKKLWMIKEYYHEILLNIENY